MSKPTLIPQVFVVAATVAAFAVTMQAQPAIARPSAPIEFCTAYPTSAHCAGTLPTCKLCHTDTGETSMGWNAYGSSLFTPLIDAGHTFDDASFATHIAAAVLAVEADDQDNDGISSFEEIELGTQPGDATSFLSEFSAPAGDTNPSYDVGNWDPEFALRRVSSAYCGASPTYDDIATLRESADPRADVHTKLETCLSSSYWREDALARIADTKIRPIDRFVFWDWDYRLWRYANLDDNDARELLTAQFHVRETSPGVLVRADELANQACTTTAPGATECLGDQFCDCPKDAGECTAPGVCQYPTGGQPCVAEKRAGLLTTTWFHFANTMFSSMPRTTAAQAMRAFLDLNPAAQEGLVHIDNEPQDLDDKGVDGYTCRQCHMAIDTAAYAFAEYQGIEAGGPSAFNANRPFNHGLWTPGNRPQSYFLTEPVDDLLEWAAAAANSDYFARQQAATFFAHATGHNPLPQETVMFDTVWRAYADENQDNYRTTQLIHRIVDTDAFGCP